MFMCTDLRIKQRKNHPRNKTLLYDDFRCASYSVIDFKLTFKTRFAECPPIWFRINYSICNGSTAFHDVRYVSPCHHFNVFTKRCVNTVRESTRHNNRVPDDPTTTLRIKDLFSRRGDRSQP